MEAYFYTNTKGEEQKSQTLTWKTQILARSCMDLMKKGSSNIIPLIECKQTEQTYTLCLLSLTKQCRFPMLTKMDQQDTIYYSEGMMVHCTRPIQLNMKMVDFTLSEKQKYPIPHCEYCSLAVILCLMMKNESKKKPSAVWNKEDIMFYNEDGDAINPIAHMDQNRRWALYEICWR